MEPSQISRLHDRLYELTPALVDDVLASFQTDARLVERYGLSLRSVAEQGVASFRDVMLGALEFEMPRVVTTELKWLDRLLQARQLDSARISLFLQIFNRRIQTDLTPQETAPLLRITAEVEAALHKVEGRRPRTGKKQVS